jgi:transcription factor WhiB
VRSKTLALIALALLVAGACHSSASKPGAICSRCLVQGECLGWALDFGSQLPGLWGGASERERKRLRAGGITGELVRRYGVRAVQGGQAERERERATGSETRADGPRSSNGCLTNDVGRGAMRHSLTRERDALTWTNANEPERTRV